MSEARGVAAPPSFECFHLPGGVSLGINSNRKLKTILLKAYLTADLDDGVTRRALLPSVLRRGSRNHPEMRAVNRFLESLYGAGLATGVTKVGEWHVVKFHLEVVNDRFLPRREDLLERGLAFFRELLFEPLEVEGGFHPEYVAQEKNQLARSIESLVDDKSAYATFRLVEEMCRHERYRLNEQGRVEDLAATGPRDLWHFYREWVERAPLSIYVAGDLEVAATRERLEAAFGRGREGGLELSPLPPPVAVKGTREISERMAVEQGKVVMGFRHGVTYRDPEYEALVLVNGILGGFSHSKLFQNVREKASLAYYASSWLERTKGLLFIGCGIAPENYQKVVEIILAQVDAMRRGEFSEDELEATVKTITNHNLMLEDNFPGLAELDFVWRLHGRTLDLAAFRENLARVTREEIVAVARRLEHDTTYFLHG